MDLLFWSFRDNLSAPLRVSSRAALGIRYIIATAVVVSRRGGARRGDPPQDESELGLERGGLLDLRRSNFDCRGAVFLPCIVAHNVLSPVSVFDILCNPAE